ncbi:MAG: TerD family protein [Deltaproteobacteria bacterium]|jgi:tellurite resistance protein TerA|nr:TerD family protein [Deltaproteobacteria bacterium]
MPKFVRGQKAKLESLTAETEFRVKIELLWPGPSEMDAACFALNGQNRLEDEGYLVFFNNKQSPEGALRLAEFSRDSAVFLTDLDKLPGFVKRLLFTLTPDGREDLGRLGPSRLTLETSDGERLVTFEFDGSLIAGDSAVELFDIYEKLGVWRCGARLLGHQGMGLRELIELHGGEVGEDEAEDVRKGPPAAEKTQLDPPPAEIILPREGK